MSVIFEKSRKGRFAHSQVPQIEQNYFIEEAFLRQDEPLLPELSELEVIRHFTQLSQENYCIDTNFYPLGSCTMKYNPKGVQKLAMLSEFSEHHPLADISVSQGLLQCFYELQEYIAIMTGMKAVSLTPMAGAQGEFAGCAMIKAYHHARNDDARCEMFICDTAHGTNPASASMCGYEIKEIPTTAEGDIDLHFLKKAVGPKTAGIMLTNPSTLGVFDRTIVEAAKMIHAAGGLLYYDGANFNAILGKVRPGDMGFDIMHLNTHKTFATPHGGGGPGSGPIAVSERLQPFLPVPLVVKRQIDSYVKYDLLTEKDCPQTIGRLSTFMGNSLILLRAYLYIRLLGAKGLKRVAEYATLNANYLRHRLSDQGFELAFPDRLATHEFIITLKKEAKTYHVNAMDVAKRLLDEGIYPPTIYFPLLIPECLLIEPTETESKQMLDKFSDVMKMIRQEILHTPEKVRAAPSRLACKRIDEVRAARQLELVWNHKKSD